MAQNLSGNGIDAALQRCAAEPAHRPGTIQPHGVLISADEEMTVTHASANSAALLRVGPHLLLGRPVADLFARETRHAMANGIMKVNGANRSVDLGLLQFGDQTLTVTASPANGVTLFEIEMAHHKQDANRKTLDDLEHLLHKARATRSRQALFDTSVELLRLLTGYDRVMVYVFDADGNGSIEAESVASGINSFLGLSFPVWDIPAQARALMQKIPFRYFYDVDASPVRILSSETEATDLDLTYAHLRGPSFVHMEYLRNMDVRAAFTLNIVLHGKPWGMIAFHHHTPRYPSQRMRQMCSHFIDVFALRMQDFATQSDLVLLEKRLRSRHARSHKADAKTADLDSDTGLLQELCAVIRADGAALVSWKSITVEGNTPDVDRIKSFVNLCGPALGVTSTWNVARDYPQLAPLLYPAFAGFLAVKLSDETLLLFFRKAQDRSIAWAGEPDKAIDRGGDKARLLPRTSFDAFVEKVPGTSAPWTPEQIRIAHELPVFLRTDDFADLMRRTRHRQSLLAEALNDRIRDFRNLVRSLPPELRLHKSSDDNFQSEIDTRIAALASVHDTTANLVARHNTIFRIFSREAEPFNRDAIRVVCSGEDAGLAPKSAPTIALVANELMTNAARHGALSNAEGQVKLHVKTSAQGVDIYWYEEGGPTCASTLQKGFGLRLIQNSVRSELQGNVDVICRESGIAVVVSLPNSVLADHSELGPDTDDQEQRALASNARWPHLRCLLVEDDYLVALNTTHVLRSVGIVIVRTATDTPEALTLIETFKPHIAVLDIQLSPDETSEAIADQLTALRIPFFFVTADADTTRLVHKYRDATALKKPVTQEDLRRALVKLTS